MGNQRIQEKAEKTTLTILPGPLDNDAHNGLSGEAVAALRLLAAREIKRQDRKRYLYRAVPWIIPTAINLLAYALDRWAFQ